MAKSVKSPGQCRVCEETYSRSGMTQHLKSCVSKNRANEDAESVSLHHMVAQVTGSPFYLHFEVASNSTLMAVDSFLRSIWLECCGHLSAFTIRDRQYCCYPRESSIGAGPVGGEQSADIPVGQVLRSQDEFKYEYDFGSTTHLDMRGVDVREGPEPEREVRVLARNEMPELECCDCGEPATRICPQCWDSNLFCDDCAPDHPCYADIGALLPLVNSPRTGICGYTGPQGDKEW